MQLAASTVHLRELKSNTLVVILALIKAFVERLARMADLVFSLRLANSAKAVSGVSVTEEHFKVASDLAAHVVCSNTLYDVFRLLDVYDSIKVDLTLLRMLVVFECRAHSPNTVLMKGIICCTLLHAFLFRVTVVSCSQKRRIRFQLIILLLDDPEDVQGFTYFRSAH